MISFVLAALTPISAAALASPVAVDEGPSIAQFLRVRAPGSPTLAPDGTLYVRDWPDGVNQLHRRPAGAALDAPMQRLTNFEDGLNSYSLSPDGRWIALSAAKGGSEQNDLHLLNTRTGAITPLFEDPDTVYTFQTWLPDSSGFVFTANDVSPRDFHIYRYDIASRERTHLLAQPGTWSVNDVSDDGTRMLIVRYISIADTRAFEFDTLAQTLLPIDPAGGQRQSYTWPVAFAHGGGSIFITSDFEDGTRRLYIYTPRDDAGAGETRPALPKHGAWDLDRAAVNPERTLLATTHNEDGYSTLRLFRLPGKQPVELPEIERGVAGIASLRGDTLVWTLNNARTPGLAYAFDAGDAEARQITARLDNEDIDLGAFQLPELISYRTFDGRMIPAFLYVPEGRAEGQTIPFVVMYHGGPEAQSRPTFNATVQYLVSRGYGVMLPNVRGSTGYGREFHQLDNYTRRWDSVKDGVEAARWLVTNGYAERGRIAAYGGSYGGFMACATVIEGQDLYGASVNIVGIVNFVTFLEHTRGYRQALREAEYGPLTDRAFLESISPINRVDEIRVPMMIAHGLNDPRVPVGEAMQLATELQRRGHDPELLYFHDEGHGFAKLENRILFNERLVRFLERTIGD
ncbi:MAG: S9 family peptidase [Phycisphaerales bacterium]|nr:MAG: S9 family peptidase [Phycisphaerales bacterium]